MGGGFCGDSGEGSALIPVVKVVCEREQSSAGSLSGGTPDTEEVGGIRYRQRLQHYGVKQGEQRDIGADAHGESGDARQCITAIFAQDAEAEAQVLKQVFDQPRAAGIAALLLDQLRAAE